MRDRILRAMPEAELRVYVVWLPVLSWMSPEAFEGAVRSRATRVTDARVRHYLDPEGKIGEAYGRLLGLPGDEPAWDAYLAFGDQARWGGAPPAPALWMHQLGGAPPELRLDVERLAREVERLLDGAAAFRPPVRPPAERGGEVNSVLQGPQ